MQETTLATFVQDIQADKVIVFFHKQGCSRCAQTKPLLEQLEKENPDVKVLSYLCAEKDEITKDLPIRVFPGIFCYRNGKRIAGNSNLYPLHFYISAFNSVEQKKSGVYDYSRIAGQLEAQLKEAQAQAEFLNDSIVQEEEGGQMIPVEDFPLGDPNEKTPEVCESCQ